MKESLQNLSTEEKIYKIANYIFANYKNIKSMDELVELSGLEKKYFITAFKKYTLETPHALLNKLKLVQAKKLLETTELPINEIAKQCGFSSANTFTKHFISKFDVNPKLYRQSKLD